MIMEKQGSQGKTPILARIEKNLTLFLCLAFLLLDLFASLFFYRNQLAEIDTEALQHAPFVAGVMVGGMGRTGTVDPIPAVLSSMKVEFASLIAPDGKELASYGALTGGLSDHGARVRQALSGKGSSLITRPVDFKSVDGKSGRGKVIAAYAPYKANPGVGAVVVAYRLDSQLNKALLAAASFFLYFGLLLSVFAGGLLFLLRSKKAAEKRLIDAAKETVWVKNQFLSNVSHELRTPLNGIMGMLSLLKSTELSKEQHEFTVVAESCAESLLELVNRILEHIKFEVGKTIINEVDFNPANLVHLLADTALPQANAKNLELKVNVAPGIPPLVRGDEEKLRHALGNLLDNAVKFTRQGSVVLSARPGAETENRFELVFSIEDTGVGIDPEKMKLIFNPLTQGDGSATREYGGLGLGLALTRELVSAMGGTLLAESRPEKGSNFSIRLPFQKVDAAAAFDCATLAAEGEGAKVVTLGDLAGRLGGNREMAAQMLSGFSSELSTTMAALRHSVSTGELPQVELLARALRQAATAFNAEELVDSALELEKSAGSGSREALPKAAKRLEAAVSTLTGRISLELRS